MDAGKVLGEGGDCAPQSVQSSSEPPHLGRGEPRLRWWLHEDLLFQRRVHERHAEVGRGREVVPDDGQDQQNTNCFWAQCARMQAVINTSVPELPHHVAAADLVRLLAMAPAARPYLGPPWRSVANFSDTKLLHELQLSLHTLRDLNWIQGRAVVLVVLLLLLVLGPLHGLMGVRRVAVRVKLFVLEAADLHA